ncbi:hypothetical protein EYF80_064753 [Liparis tanakae]|uniref:Uncharacterized protein n=1 Tax=Liparis tanakae TaxID=230148 RepID=A0A4Z2E8I9_9TELE|nr:hypothetical protein EYF80_064753 [Liparis tanakae]
MAPAYSEPGAVIFHSSLRAGGEERNAKTEEILISGGRQVSRGKRAAANSEWKTTGEERDGAAARRQRDDPPPSARHDGSPRPIRAPVTPCTAGGPR